MKNRLKITLAAIAFVMLNLVFGASAFADAPPPPTNHGHARSSTRRQKMVRQP